MVKQNNQNREEKAKYEDTLKYLKDGFETYKEFFYTSLVKKEYGAEGQKDGWIAARLGFKKLGLEGILGSLDAQIETALQGNDGYGVSLNVSDAIKQNAAVFEGCALALKIKDLIPYIKNGLGDVEVKEEKDYMEKTLVELVGNRKATKKEQIYGSYLLSQLRNSIIAEMTPLVYREKASRFNEEYIGKKEKVLIQLPNGAVLRTAA